MKNQDKAAKLQEILNDLTSCIGMGWIPLVTDLCVALFRKGWDGEVAQIKEKFGGLRFYIDSADVDLLNIIEDYENLSFTICETCGTKDKVQTIPVNGWTVTICPSCKKDRK